MAQEQVVEGLVLRRWNAPEADKWVSFLTREQGKLRLRVRGAHKPGSRMGMLSEPLNVLRTRVIQGRHQRLMVQPQMVTAFLKVRSDLERLSAAMALTELLDRWLPEEHGDPPVYEIALAALTALEAGQDVRLVMGWALWQLLMLSGFCPALDACARCRRTHCESGWLLNPAEGQLLCAPCGGTNRQLPRLSQTQLEQLRHWLHTPLRELASPKGMHDPDTVRRLLTLAVRYAEHYLEDSPRWLAFLERLNTLPATE
jgi:DNA repair protein RecO (recombination protein O)